MNELTMSSREITALTGKKHYNVMRDIELLAAQLEVDVSQFSSIYTDSQNREQTEYLLDIETCLCLVATYNAKLRMKVIKRWQELEQGETKLYKLVQAGKFPKPIKFGANITAWRNQDVLDWIAKQTTTNTTQT